MVVLIAAAGLGLLTVCLASGLHVISRPGPDQVSQIWLDGLAPCLERAPAEGIDSLVDAGLIELAPMVRWTAHCRRGPRAVRRRRCPRLLIRRRVRGNEMAL